MELLRIYKHKRHLNRQSIIITRKRFRAIGALK